MSVIVKTRGVADARRLFDDVARRTEGDSLDRILPSVIEIQEDWWASLGRGTWEGHDLEVTGALRAAATQESAAGQRVEIDADEVVFGLARGGPGDPGFYGQQLADRGWSPIVDPSGADAEQLAEDYAETLVRDA